MNKKKVICLVIPTLQSGGMERVMSELADYFSTKERTEVHLILYGKGREIFYELPESVQVHQPQWQFRNRLRTYYTVKTLLYLRKTVKQLSPDVVLSFGEYWNSFVLISLYGLKMPVYISDRCSPNKDLGNYHEILRKVLYSGASGIIAQTSKAECVYKRKRLNKNIRTIGNPIRRIENDGSHQIRENIVLTVGRLISTKHHDRLIEIFRKANPGNWKLIIAGGNANQEDGMSYLKGIIREKGLEDQVILTGVTSDVDELYLKSKIFAFTSSSEGFPNVIGEAMSAGMPVIAYDCVAGPEDMIVHDENGCLIDLFDDDTFTARLSELMSDPEKIKQMGKNARQSIKRFNSGSIAEEYLNFITKEFFDN